MKKLIYVFQGDSITDCNRDRSQTDSLGDGYVSILQSRHPELFIINRGISGDRVNELLNRWQEDALDLNPDVISIYVGINDVWHHHEWGKPYSIASFITMYQTLIDQVKKQNPRTQICLISPFVLKMGHYKAVWQKDIDDIIQAVESLSKRNQTLYLPLSEVFRQANLTYTADELTWDGVHPKNIGHEIIASAIEEVLKLSES
jgi:acyl-CoA thioesterase I